MPAAPACTYRKAPSGVASASTVPASVGVWPSRVIPSAAVANLDSDALPAFEAYRYDPASVTQHVAAWPVGTEDRWVSVPSECTAYVVRAPMPVSVTAR